MSFSLGTFAGTTALSIALVLPQDGQMVTIDVNDDWVATGRQFGRRYLEKLKKKKITGSCHAG